MAESLSSNVMSGIIFHRNQPGSFKKAQAQIALPFVTVAATIETVVASIFTLLSTLALPATNVYFNGSIKLLKSSSFTILWSIVDFFMNPFCYVLAAEEEHAMGIAVRGNIAFL